MKTVKAKQYVKSPVRKGSKASTTGKTKLSAAKDKCIGSTTDYRAANGVFAFPNAFGKNFAEQVKKRFAGTP